MADINSVNLTGRATRDLELKYTSGGMAIGKVGIAVNKRVKQGEQWVEKASFFDVTIFGKTAEGLAQYITKGKELAITGSLEQSSWEKDGQKHSKIEINADNIKLMGGRDGQKASTNGQKASSAPAPLDEGNYFEDSIPF